MHIIIITYQGEKDWNKLVNEDIYIFMGLIIVALGIALGVYSVLYWRTIGYSKLNPEVVMRIAIPVVTLLEIGVEAVFFGFMVGILKMR